MDSRRNQRFLTRTSNIASRDEVFPSHDAHSDCPAYAVCKFPSQNDNLPIAFLPGDSVHHYTSSERQKRLLFISLSNSIKRTLDLILASLGLVILAPLFVIIAAAIRLDSGLPVIFRQTRTGRDGKLFRIYKFRTMTTAEDNRDVTQACQGDKRVTRVGRFLRATSLDELPQLLNVIVGDMSLVGPRPHALAHDQYYSARLPDYTLRQRVLPGITGWAQVNGHRGETPDLAAMARRLELDRWYIEHWSLWLDIKILARTITSELGRSRFAC
jgi:exopolysaccharide biosynthesis polyprenyl glycosylphosphotransferase